jgi:hypothetical protein
MVGRVDGEQSDVGTLRQRGHEGDRVGDVLRLQHGRPFLGGRRDRSLLEDRGGDLTGAHRARPDADSLERVADALEGVGKYPVTRAEIRTNVQAFEAITRSALSGPSSGSADRPVGDRRVPRRRLPVLYSR